MDIKQIYDIMSDNLEKLKETVQSIDVGYENLADISLAMLQTAQFWWNWRKNILFPNSQNKIIK